MRIVVAGAAGFIGSHLCDRLLAEGHPVVGLDNLLTGAPRNIGHLAGDPRFEFLERDITQPFAVAGAVDAVVNMASPASPQGLSSTIRSRRWMLARWARGGCWSWRGPRTPVFCWPRLRRAYGDPAVHPQVETYWGNVNPVGPRSCYDESKRFAEALTMAYHRKHGLATNIARIFNTYGPRMKLNDGRVVPAFLDQALRDAPMTVFGEGKQTRSFCYVSDLVDGLYRLMLADERYPVNLGNPQEMTILEFAERIRALTGTKVADRISAAARRRSPAAAARYLESPGLIGLGAARVVG